MKVAKFSELESRVGRVASRRARRQLMHVSWDRFHKAYEEYVRWQAFTLWARAIVELEGSTPSWLQTMLRRRCPGFQKQAANPSKPELLGLKLPTWVHRQVFGLAKKEGWLDALAFYGFRDTRSQGYWAYWEHCESEWKKKPPAAIPSFVRWRRSALDWKLHGDVSSAAITSAVEDYIRFEAFLYWLRPLLQTKEARLPAQIAIELREVCPSLLEFWTREISAANRTQARSWRLLVDWSRDHVLGRPKKEGWLDHVVRQTELHPRHVRLAAFSALYCKSRLETAGKPYPSFRQWQRDVQSSVEARRN